MPTPTDPAEWISEQREELAKCQRHTGISSNAKDRLVKALDALEAVLALHRPNNEQLTVACIGCGPMYTAWPCPTVRAIEEKLAG